MNYLNELPSLNARASWPICSQKKNSNSGGSAFLLKLARHSLDLVHHPQQVAAPQFCDLLLRIAAAHKLQRHIERFGGIVPSRHAAAAFEVRRDADVIDADQLDRVVDVIDEILDGGGRIARISFIDLLEFLMVASTLRRGQLRQSVAPRLPLPRRQLGQSNFFPERRKGGGAFG